MKEYIVEYKDYNTLKGLRVVARSITKALEVAEKYIKKNYYNQEIRNIVYQNEINAVQK